jgi:hypothetical protein
MVMHTAFSSYNHPDDGATTGSDLPIFVTKQGDIDTPALVAYCASHLLALENEAQRYINGERYKAFWNQLQALIFEKSGEEKQELLRVERQLVHLPEVISQWHHLAVDSMERFNFFVAVKAKEIASGDEKHDYYWALQIRHDQLVALVEVMELLLGHIRRWVEMDALEVIGDGVFLGLETRSVEEQIYLEAERIHTLRASLPR